MLSSERYQTHLTTGSIGRISVDIKSVKDENLIKLVNSAANGNTESFRSIVGQYQGFVFALVRRFVRSRPDAEDIVQEVFIRLWKNLRSYKTDMKFSTWLYRITVNKCFDYLKSGEFKSGRQSGSADQLVIAGGRSADEPLINAELKDAVEACAASLTPKQKAVFFLRDVEGLEMNEIAEILAMSTGNIKSNLYYARVKMAELLNSYYAERRKQNI
jgi:RNA polymerase sigma-70 factor, ECF subfamily